MQRQINRSWNFVYLMYSTSHETSNAIDLDSSYSAVTSGGQKRKCSSSTAIPRQSNHRGWLRIPALQIIAHSKEHKLQIAYVNWIQGIYNFQVRHSRCVYNPWRLHIRLCWTVNLYIISEYRAITNLPQRLRDPSPQTRIQTCFKACIYMVHYVRKAVSFSRQESTVPRKVLALYSR